MLIILCSFNAHYQFYDKLENLILAKTSRDRKLSDTTSDHARTRFLLILPKQKKIIIISIYVKEGEVDARIERFYKRGQSRSRRY